MLLNYFEDWIIKFETQGKIWLQELRWNDDFITLFNIKDKELFHQLKLLYHNLKICAPSVTDESFEISHELHFCEELELFLPLNLICHQFTYCLILIHFVIVELNVLEHVKALAFVSNCTHSIQHDFEKVLIVCLLCLFLVLFIHLLKLSKACLHFLALLISILKHSVESLGGINVFSLEIELDQQLEAVFNLSEKDLLIEVVFIAR